MILRILGILFSFISTAQAELTVTPRYEYFGSSEQVELAHRLLTKGQWSFNKGPVSVFIEGFAQYDRTDHERGYLQEAYLEYKKGSVFFRLGRQPLRWSESWLLPSLDIWTGRRWDRFFFDPLSEQLSHPTGISMSYVKNSYSLDVVGITTSAETTYPGPVSDGAQRDLFQYGARLRGNLAGFGWSAMSAQVQKKNVYGLSGNYAFESFVPKFEWGSQASGEQFIATGVDVFWGDWILMPQVNFVEQQVLSYFSAQRRTGKSDFQIQIYNNSEFRDFFSGLSYGYNISEAWTLTGFIQNYQGTSSLYRFYQEVTKDVVVGVRTEWSGSLMF